MAGAARWRGPLKLRVMLELRYYDGLSNHEIAEALGVPIGTVMTRLRDGQRRIRGAVSTSRDDE